MKRIILTLCMTMIACITAFAQKALFEKYSETDGVSTVYISRNMMRMMGNVKQVTRISARLQAVSTIYKYSPANVLH